MSCWSSQKRPRYT